MKNTEQQKTYFGFVNDHSSSMRPLSKIAIADFNATIKAVKLASTLQMSDTIVSTVSFGGKVEKQLTVSNPHVLKPIENWKDMGNTSLYDAIGAIVEMHLNLPDADEDNVSFVIQVTTDGEENSSMSFSKEKIKEIIHNLQKTGRWTFAFRVPKGSKDLVVSLGVSENNVHEWDTTEEGLKKATVSTIRAIDNFYIARSTGSKSTNVFYSDTKNVDVSELNKLKKGKDITLYVVDNWQDGIEIRDFILSKRMEYLKGSAFYQLSKTEARVGRDKVVVIRDRKTGDFYTGVDARKMIGLPNNKNARLHPGNHGDYDIFIQSQSVNRKLVAGTGVLYWAAIGKPFTQAELRRVKTKKSVNGVVQLPQVGNGMQLKVGENKNIKQSCYVGDVIDNNQKFFNSRQEMRNYAKKHALVCKDAGSSAANGQRWYVVA